MARQLVVCCDGTWNTPRNETSVFRTYRFLRERLGSPAEVTQKDTWKALSAKLKLVPEGVRAVGPSVVGPSGDALLAAGEMRRHPSLVSRFGKRCTTILSEGKNLRQEGDSLPPNVQADTLPMFP